MQMMNRQLKYNRARLAILRMIASSGLCAGDSLPSQKQLTRLLPFGEITIRHALASMQESGLISSRHGSGTYLVRDIRKEKFQHYILLVSAYSMHDAPWENNAGELRVYLAGHGIGLQTVTVSEFDQEVINAVTDGCIGILAEGWLTDEWILNLQGTGIPVVVLGNNDLSVDVPSVSIDMEEGAYQMTRAMLSEGLSGIVLFRGEDGYCLAEQEEQGYRRAMVEAGLEAMAVKSPDHYSYYEVIEQFMAGHQMPEGILSEQGGMMDFIGWAWNYRCLRQPVLGFLSKPAFNHRAFQGARFFSLQFASYFIRGGQMLLDYFIDEQELHSEKIPPVVPELK